VPLEADVWTVLTAGTPTAAGARVYRNAAPQGAAEPRITFARATNAPVVSLSGRSGLDQVRLQVDCWAKRAEDAQALAHQVRLLLEAQPFKALMQNDFSAFEPDTKLHRWSMDFRCWDRL